MEVLEIPGEAWFDGSETCESSLPRHCRLPARLASIQGVLLFQPIVERLEVFEHRSRIEMIFASHCLERQLPGLGGAGSEHGVQLRASSFRAEEAAPVQRTPIAGRFAHRFVELELVDRSQIVAGI